MSFPNINGGSAEPDQVVVPRERILGVEEFYSSSVKSATNLLPDDDISGRKELNEELLGKLVIDRMLATAELLKVQAFVLPIGGSTGLGRALPVVRELTEYKRVWTEFNKEELEDRLSSMKRREAIVAALKVELEEKEDLLKKSISRLDGLRVAAAALRNAGNSEAQVLADGERNFMEAEVHVQALHGYVKDLSKEWSNEDNKLLIDKREVRSLLRETDAKAIEQHKADTDAVSNLHIHLSALKRYIHGIVSKVKGIDEVARTVGPDNQDPMVAGDMRRVYANLVQRYRRSDSLGITTTIMDLMRKVMIKGQTLSQFFAIFETACQDLESSHVTMISTRDFLGMCALSGMTRESRDDFLKMETTITLSTMVEEVSGEFDDNVSTVSRSGGPKSLFGKVQRFVRDWESMNRVSNTLAGAGSKGSGQQPVAQSKESNAGAKKSHGGNKAGGEPAPVFAAQEAGNVCYPFLHYGVCNRAGCQFTHYHTNYVGVPKACPDFAKNECKRGAYCIFMHGNKAVVGGERRWNRTSHGGGSAPAQAKPASNKTGAGSQGGVAENIMMACQEEDISYVSFEQHEATHCVLEEGEKEESVCAVSESRESKACRRVTALIDSAASRGIANDWELLAEPQKLDNVTAYGVGGASKLTHEGRVPLFNCGDCKFAITEKRNHPNLVSVGRFTQPDEVTGQGGLVIFGAKGGVRLRLTDELQVLMKAFLNRAEELDQVVGVSVQKGFVYEETFTEGLLDPIEPADCEQFNAVLDYASGRIKMCSVESTLHLLVAAGVGKDALLGGLKQSSLAGIPSGITVADVNAFYRKIGKDVPMMEAEITKPVIRAPEDLVDPDGPLVPGSSFQMDNCDPSYSRMVQEDEPTDGVEGIPVKSYKKPVPGCMTGDTQCLIAVDAASLYMMAAARSNKASPHLALGQFVRAWQGRWRTLKSVRVDSEFVTEASIDVAREHGVLIRQSVPGDHRFNTSRVEGCIRWVQDMTQGSMNRVGELVKDGTLTRKECRSLWFFATRMSVTAWNLKPSKCDKSKTRHEEGTGEVASLHNIVMLPFGMKIVGKKLRNNEDGRGDLGLYVGPSPFIRGGVLLFNLRTRVVSAKYGFRAVIPVQPLSREEYMTAAQRVYGEVLKTKEFAARDGELAVIAESIPVETASGGEVRVPAASELQLEVGHGEQEMPIVYDEVPPAMVGEAEKGVTDEPVDPLPRVKKKVVEPASGQHKYFTRRSVGVHCTMAYSLEDRGPKPVAPSGSKKIDDPEWEDADMREATKLNEEDTFTPLPTDERGNYILPPGAIVLRMLRVREFKWKKDPKTGVERWLPCVRFVCDGSTDNRPDKFYAETPDRTLLLLMTSVGATLGESVSTSDVERAYLNAQSIDRNIVVKAARDMKGLPRMALLNKGLYGSRGGSLSWQLWIDARMAELGWTKRDVARGVYTKLSPEGVVIRAYRHSDDFKLSSLDTEARVAEEVAMRSKIRMAAFTACERFLGCTFEYVGNLVLVRQKDKINEMEEKFKHLHMEYNKRNYVRTSPLPVSAIRADDELVGDAGVLLDKDGQAEYQSLVGCISWIAASSRPDVKFGYFVLSTRLCKPRQWDMELAVRVMDYLVATKDVPLVLGGPVVQPEVHADASFANLDERRSAIGHVLTTCPGSGAVFATVGKTKCAVTSVFEAELVSGCMGVDTALYATQACIDLMYPVEDPTRVVKVDNMAEVDWINGSVSNRRTRHVDVRWYRVRHLQESGQVRVEFIPTRHNVADILTKPLQGAEFTRAAGMILGHKLIQDWDVPWKISIEAD